MSHDRSNEAIDALLSPLADDLFASVAAFGDARELEILDVASGQSAARKAILSSIHNALLKTYNPGARLSLIKGDAGSGKSHVLTTSFKRAAAIGNIYPAVLQLTAPVSSEGYAAWLVDATIRQLSARHFADDSKRSPLNQLASKLLERLEPEQRDSLIRAIDDFDADDEADHAQRCGRRLARQAEILPESPPSPGFFAVLLLAGLGDAAALTYLRLGRIERRLECLELDLVETPSQRIEIVRMIGLAIQFIGGCLALGFDQVENSVRLGSEDLFVHAVTQAVRIAETIPNCAVLIVTLGVEYEDLAEGRRGNRGLPISDRDRIENDPPFPVALDLGTPQFRRDVVAQRLAVLRERAKLSPRPGSLDPLPEWLVKRIEEARSIRVALRSVSRFRTNVPDTDDLVDGSGEQITTQEIDFDKEWADFHDLDTVSQKLLDVTKGALLAWWVERASEETANGDPATVASRTMEDAFKTSVVEIGLSKGGIAVERRELALCEAPNRNQKLADQIEQFLHETTGVPAVLRTNGFPKGRTAQVAPALRKLESLFGLQLDLNETEWHTLKRANEFDLRHREAAGFVLWARDKQWLLQLVSPLQPLITLAEIPDADDVALQVSATAEASGLEAPVASVSLLQTADGFPVELGNSFEGAPIAWDPYRAAPNHLNNFSFLVTGDAGSGKTQTIRVLINAACRKGLALTIFDFKADYCDAAFADPLGIEVIDVRAGGLPFNPMQPPPRGASGVQPVEHAYELAGILKRVFRLGDVQQGALRDAIIDVYTSAGIEPREWIDPITITWPSFDSVLERLRADGNAALVTRLAVLVDLGLFPPSAGKGPSFETFLQGRICLKLSDLPSDEIKSALAEILIVQLHGYALREHQPRRLTRMLVFDEAHRVKDSLRLESLAREGRAFGVGLVIGTQFPGDIPESLAGNLATQLSLMNNQARHRNMVVTQLYGTTGSPEARKLLDQVSRLRPLEGLFINAHYNGILIKLLPHYARYRSTIS